MKPFLLKELYMKFMLNTLGERISEAVKEAVDLVAAGEPGVMFEFSGINLKVKPGMSVEDVCTDFERQLEAEFEAYITSTEYKDRKLKSEERTRERAPKCEAALTKAPQMSLRDPEEWLRYKDTNRNSYHDTAVLTYAERWARLMEGAILEGATIAGCAKEMAILADIEDIKGFVYDAAVSLLVKVWVHGEELNRWHSKACS